MSKLLSSCVVVALFSSFAHAEDYLVTHLGAGYAFAINNNGTVVGAQADRAAKWQGETIEIIGAPASSALAINDAGVIVGVQPSSGSMTMSEGVLWSTLSGQSTFSGTTEIVDINDNGISVGNGQFIYCPQGCVFPGALSAQRFSFARINAGDTHLNVGYGTQSTHIMRAINNVGLAVGQKNGQAAVYARDNVTVLPDLYGEAEAWDINDQNLIVGRMRVSPTKTSAVLWFGERFLELPTPAASNENAAFAINDHGLVVGVIAEQSAEPEYELQNQAAVLWKDQSLVNLNDTLPAGTAWTLLQAHDINDRGEIVGIGLLRPDNNIEAFLLSPDCNSNAVSDVIEIETNVVRDTNQNWIPDACE